MSDIIDRINKLLALASSDNEEEAALAAEHATRLMLKHAIREDQLHGAKHSSVKPIERTIQVFPPKYTGWQQYQLADGIAHHLLCQTYYYGHGLTYPTLRPLLSDFLSYVYGVKAGDRADISPSARLNASTDQAVLV